MDKQIRCECGRVLVEMSGPRPILTVLCFCDDCQSPAQLLEKLPDAASIREKNGGTAMVCWRQDRVLVSQGEDLLEVHRLREDSPTDRLVATCCNTPMYLDFRKGHWLSLYRQRFSRPPDIELAIQTKFMADLDVESLGVPVHSTFPISFILRMVKARVAMLLGR